MKIENIFPSDTTIRGAYTPCKRIDMGDFYTIYVSGVEAPQDENHCVTTDDVGEQTRLVFEEVEKRLNLAGATLDHVVKAVIYLTNMDDFDVVSPIRAEYFKNSMPVSTLVEVSRLTRTGAKIEVEVTALVNK